MSRIGRAVVWLAAGLLTVGLIGLVLELVGQPPALRTQPAGGTMLRRDAPPWARWTVTEQLSAHNVLVVHVETDELDEALPIARQVIDPLRSQYAEILVYFHRPGRPDPVAPRRVQWTRAKGYVETSYE